MNGRGHVRANRRARSVRAAIVRKWRGSNNSQRYLHRASMRWIAFSRRGSRNCSRPNPLKTLTFLPPLFPSSLDPRGGGRRRQRFGATIKPLADGSIHRRGNCPAEVKRGAVWKMCCIAEMGIPAVYFPEMFVAIERRGGGKEGMDRNIEFLLIPSLERFRDGELTIEEYIVERFYSRII